MYGIRKGAAHGMEEMVEREERMDKLRIRKRELRLDHDLFYQLFPEYQDRPQFDEDGTFFAERGHERLSVHCHEVAVTEMANDVNEEAEFGSSMSRDELASWRNNDDTNIMHFCEERKEYKERMCVCEQKTGMGPNMEVYTVYGLDYRILQPHPPYSVFESERHVDTMCEPEAKCPGYMSLLCQVNRQMRIGLAVNLVKKIREGAGYQTVAHQNVAVTGYRQCLHLHLCLYQWKSNLAILRGHLFPGGTGDVKV